MLLANPGAAGAAGLWGPGISYLDGVVCAGADAQTALVSWPGPSSGPAFALDAVTGPPRGRSGPTLIPAVNGTSAPLPDGGAGLSSAQIGAIAYLIQHHGQGRSDIVADVAARIVGQVSGNVYVTDCLQRHVGGLSPDIAERLWNEAVTNGGPYRVTVIGPAAGAQPGRATPITARVTSASGAPVAGMTVSFAADVAGSVSPPTAVTDAAGRAQVSITTDTSTRVIASISAVSELVQTTGGAAVPLVSAAEPSVQSGVLRIASSASASPVLSVAATHTLVPTDTALSSTLGVGGMRGHRGNATVDAYGPLAYSARTGCAGHTAAEWTAERAGRAVDTGRATVVGDGTYDVTTDAIPRAGCYQLFATVATTNATPNVTRAAVGPVITVAPITIVTAPTGHGLAPNGPLRSTLSVRAGPGVSLRDVAATLVGPRTPQSGSCPLTGWAGLRAAAADASVAGTQVNSSDVNRAGCYGFRITGRLEVAGSDAATVTIDPDAGNQPVLVLTPKVTLAALSATHVDTGGRVQATITVAGSEDQAGVLRLQLLRLPYTSRGCLGLNWSDASAVPATGDVPTTAVSGDGSYRVRSAVVPTKACWTVAPVFTANANGAVQASGIAGADPTLAFVSTAAPVAAHTTDTSAPAANDNSRIVLTGVLGGVLLVVVLAVVVVLARRSRNSAD